ncbi:MAG: translation initiation factor IF-1 [Candidatus Omnitrophica bacterium]|nr:translation initiation factor IF-1 [Candidatus Omnitrophota bacterium]MCB9719943.1 translation initiation factor IF-1 [Candidatus Omnitrophota bacterium]
MTKEDAIEIDGIVTKALSNAKYAVQMDTGHLITAYPAGKLRKYFIKILPGDRGTVSISPYDLSLGRITYRHKK